MPRRNFPLVVRKNLSAPVRREMGKIASRVVDRKAETKTFVLTVGPRSVMTVGGFVSQNVAAITGGNEQNKRIGHSIKPKKLELGIQILNNNGTTEMYVRVAVVRRRGKLDGTADLPSAYQRHFDLDKWIVLYDRIHHLQNATVGTTAVRGGKNINLTFRNLPKITWDTGLLTEPEMNGLYVMFSSENSTAGNEPTFGLQSRLNYKDI